MIYSAWLETRGVALAAMATIGLTMLLPGTALSDEPAWQVWAETGPLWFSRNDVRIPNSDEGDRFDLLYLTGSGPDTFLRIGGEYHWRDRHSFTGLYAPVRVSGRGVLTDDTRFAGGEFTGAETVRGTYQFNTYRLGWRYHWIENDSYRIRIGVTALVRDANVKLRQGQQRADDPDLGLVPLLSVQATRYWSNGWALDLDVEGLGAPQGRAIDAALALEYSLSPQLTARLGYRTLEGGADNSSVYTFAWLHYGLIGLRYRF